MKRINLTIILSIMLSVVVPFTSVASEVGATIGSDLSITGSYDIDPRTDEKYKDKFVAPTEFEYKATGDIVIKYKLLVDGKETIQYYFSRLWSEQKYMGLCLSSSADCVSGYNLAQVMLERNKKEVCVYADSSYGNGEFTTNRNNPYANSYSNSIYTACCTGANVYDFEVVECDFPIFSSYEDMEYYTNTGVIRNAIYDPTVHYSGDDLYFKDFRVVPHVSTLFSCYYFDVYYELSDFALANIDTLNLRLDNDYRISILRAEAVSDEVYSNNNSLSIALKGKETGFKLYLSDFNSIGYVIEQNGINDYDVLGHPGQSDSSLSGVNKKTTYSNLYLRFYLRCNTSSGFKQSRRNDYNHDFLSNKGDTSVWVPTSDSALNGNFDYTQKGNTVSSNSYYYNEVTTNENGDTVNKYYYVDNGKKTEITENEYNNNSYNISGDSGGGGGGSSSSGGNATANAVVGDIVVNVGGQGDYVNISPKDYKTFVDNVKDMLEELDTKGGLFLMLKDVYALFPPTIWVIVGGGLSAVVIVSIVKILRG